MFNVFKRSSVRRPVAEGPPRAHHEPEVHIPVPDAAEIDGDAAWALWDQAVQELEGLVASTRTPAAESAA
ncbi:hypothetical protein JI739_02240 [Ramlibacter sp. AW1]|uniref:Uncharacterized protein n=1 Tax=Ramlibacter aurantiacus TaxID=2801330 RepID=A0A936ZDX2_9BURK|nr:hypothetical protein [Ramlibacter aurantiacus]MBL0419157.1 hypothetical protein [Ramlibacter aurantiacus]